MGGVGLQRASPWEEASRANGQMAPSNKMASLGNYTVVWQSMPVGVREEWELRLQRTVGARRSCVSPGEAKTFSQSIHC